MIETYRWVVIGYGAIANEMAQTLAEHGRMFYGVAGRNQERTAAFAENYQIQKIYGKIEEVFADDQVDIVYIATPHNTHIQYLREALKAGKHVLCEKAVTLNTEELKEARQLAEKQDIVLAEAMTIYHMPLYKKLQEVVADGKLGKLQMIQVSFGSYKEYNMSNRFFDPALAGGALLDIGVYALAFARIFLSQAPDQILSKVRTAPSGVDEQVGILMANPANEMVTVTLTLHAKQPKRGVVIFEKGYVEIYDYPRADQAVITYTEDGRKEIVACGRKEEALFYEVEDMEQAVLGGKNEMDLSYTSDVMDIMTKIRQRWSLVYPEETTETECEI